MDSDITLEKEYKLYWTIQTWREWGLRQSWRTVGVEQNGISAWAKLETVVIGAKWGHRQICVRDQSAVSDRAMEVFGLTGAWR